MNVNQRQNQNKKARVLKSLSALSLLVAGSSYATVGNLIWEENFDSLDSNIWNIDIGDGCDQGLCGWGNQELQWYSANNVAIETIAGEGTNKALILEAKSENSNGRAFTSGKVTSKDNVTIHYGMIETRIKVPDLDTGLWPAAWLLGTSSASWPAKGEIDMMEMGHKKAERRNQGHRNANINSYVGSNLIFYSDAACSSGNPTCAASIAYDVNYNKPYVASTPMNDRFVIYRTYWDDTSIRFTVTDNGTEYDLYEAPFTIGADSDEFQQPFYLLLNMAVGGTFTDAATNNQVTAPLPGKMAIDYIRVYEYNGQGTVTVPTPPVVVTEDVTIEAENYVNYFDTTAGNTGGAYRSDNVDIEATADAGGGFNVGWIDNGEWLEYSVELGAGTYDLTTRVASDVGGGAYSVSVNSQSVGSNTVGATGGWQGWQTQQVGSFTVSEGVHTIRVDVSTGLFNLNWLNVKKNAVAPSEYGLTQTSDTSVQFYVNRDDWADVHYLVNGVNQQNVRMALSGGVNTHDVSGLSQGDVITFWFTYLDDQGLAFDTDTTTHTMGSGPVDSDGDGVIDANDQCPNTPAGSTVDANGCEVVVDSDGDGVEDSLDLCPNTPQGTTVDANGCEVVTSEYGLTQTSDTSVQFYVNRDSWADVHYLVNGGGQQNVRMALSGGVNTHDVNGLSQGDELTYWFTYLDDQGLAFDTPTATYTMGSGGTGPVDSDGDGVIDANDLCPNTPAGATVDANGCEIVTPPTDSDGDGVADENDLCPNTTPGATVDANGCEITPPPADSDGDGVADENDQCPNTPAGTTVDSTGCEVQLGNITPLYNAATPLEPAIVYDRGDAIVTQFADRARDRHAKEDQFQNYDHYLSHYWTHRTARFKFEDYVTKGGSSIVVTFVTEWKLGATEFRAWYYGMNTVAEYHGNYQNDVIDLGRGTYDADLNKVSSTGDQYKYQLTINQNRGLDGSVNPLAVGQAMEIEVSQFLDGVPEGRANYYGTTYLYMVGTGGMVPWYTVGDFADKSSERENSHKLDEAAWLGGETTLPFGYTNEPDNHFMQMATNLAAENGQPFVLGRRVHHTDFETGQHDELPENGIFPDMVGLAGPHYVSASCSGCHERNGRAHVASVGSELEKWVFKVGDINGNAHPDLGRVLQGANDGINDATHGEGTVTLGAWTENNGLRSPNYVFSKTTPETFSARLAPQLVGLGLLEAISEADILALEDVNDANSDGISGKANRVLDPVTGETRIGRFGYKAGTTSIKHQVAAAFNTDMGVMTSVLPNPDCGSAQTTCGASGSEIADVELDRLVKYIALLGVRPQRDHTDAQVVQGKNVFNTIGCAGCHTGSYQTSQYHPLAELRSQNIQPYTDLLLHDMGPGLADNLGEGLATGSEWRTAPLWGLGLSACVTGGVTNPTGQQGGEVCTADESYLHDGRARTIEEAILWHGGEGQASNNAYQALNGTDKAALEAFLKSL